jgi:hypothetical protein
VRFIEANRRRWGVEPICTVLQFPPSTYYAARCRPACPRKVRDAELKVEVLRVFRENRSVYGADKVWAQLRREGSDVARCTVERLMRELGIKGATRGKTWTRTTVSDASTWRPADLVERKFVAPAPNRLWVADLTYVKTHVGWAYVAFVIDVFSRFVVGWQVSESLRTDLALALDALEMAVFTRRSSDLSGLVHHSDLGSTCPSVTPSDSPRLDSSPRSAAAATATTTLSPRASTGSTRPSSSASRARGGASTTSSSPRWATSTGSTTAGCTARSAWCHRLSSSLLTTIRLRQRRRLLTNKPSLHQTRGGSR